MGKLASLIYVPSVERVALAVCLNRRRFIENKQQRLHKLGNLTEESKFRQAQEEFAQRLRGQHPTGVVAATTRLFPAVENSLRRALT
jgi:hypothetical protein